MNSEEKIIETYDRYLGKNYKTIKEVKKDLKAYSESKRWKDINLVLSFFEEILKEKDKDTHDFVWNFFQLFQESTLSLNRRKHIHNLTPALSALREEMKESDSINDSIDENKDYRNKTPEILTSSLIIRPFYSHDDDSYYDDEDDYYGDCYENYDKDYLSDEEKRDLDLDEEEFHHQNDVILQNYCFDSMKFDLTRKGKHNSLGVIQFAQPRGVFSHTIGDYAYELMLPESSDETASSLFQEACSALVEAAFNKQIIVYQPGQIKENEPIDRMLKKPLDIKLIYFVCLKDEVWKIRLAQAVGFKDKAVIKIPGKDDSIDEMICFSIENTEEERDRLSSLALSERGEKQKGSE